MDDIIKSSAFQEFLQKRSEEIITDDKVCQDINKELLALEKELLPTLSEESLKKVLRMDALTHKLIDRIPTVLHRQIYDNYDKLTIIFKGQAPKLW
jgi:hypothetical protein